MFEMDTVLSGDGSKEKALLDQNVYVSWSLIRITKCFGVFLSVIQDTTGHQGQYAAMASPYQVPETMVTGDVKKPYTRAEAELLHRRVVSNCDVINSSHNLSLDLFVKALALWTLRQHGNYGDLEDRFHDVLVKISESFKIVKSHFRDGVARGVPPAIDSIGEKEAAVLKLHQDYIHDIWLTYTRRKQTNPGRLNIGGKGLARMRERAYITNMTNRASTCLADSAKRNSTPIESLNVMDELKLHSQPGKYHRTYGTVVSHITDGTLGGEFVIKGRRQFMDLLQFQTFCRHIGLVPDILPMNIVVRVFKWSNDARSTLPKTPLKDRL